MVACVASLRKEADVTVTVHRPATVYIDLSRLLADSATAAAGALNASAVHDALSDVWLLAEEDIILRLPKTSDAAHTAVLKDVLAQVTSSARHRGIVIDPLPDETLPAKPVSRPALANGSAGSKSGRVQISTASPRSAPATPLGPSAAESGPPTQASLRRLLQTATQLRRFRLHLPPAARAAGKGLPPSSTPAGQPVAAAGDVLPPGADLYCGALGAEEVLQVLRRVQLAPGQEVQLRLKDGPDTIRQLQTRAELESLLETKDLHMQAGAWPWGKAGT
ncbi:hypothetical protein V8C86DRAFT_3082508 [Haematococcus lacustris]